MKRFSAIAAVLLLMLSVPSAAHAASTLTPGLYEYTMKMNMPGMPMNMPAQTSRRCLDPNDVESNRALEMPPEPNSDCRVSDMVMTGSNFSYKIACTRPQKLNGNVKGAVTSNSMTMDMTMTIPEVPGPVQQTVAAKRVGDCK